MNSAFSRCRLMKAERSHPALIRRILRSAALLFILWFMAAPADVHAAEASVAGARIEGGNVVVAATGITATDDGIYHLFAQFPYENGTQGVEVAQAPAADGAVFVFPLMKDTPHSYLCRKFTLVVWQGGKLRQVGAYHYISNPEVLSASPRRRLDYGKKGLLISSELFERLEFADLGIRQITYNVPIGNLCNGGGVPFIYNGKQYEFNYNVVRQYDFLIPNMNKCGIQVSLVILNNWANSAELIHPLSRDYRRANYYAFNTADAAGTEKLEAIAAFLAQRYSGNGLGQVDNWIIGNEVNARTEWHYMSAAAGLDTDVKAYADAVRLFYNTIRSINANARIYTSFDFEYNASTKGGEHYPAKPFLNLFNDIVRSEGNMEWHVGIHPYNYPIYDPVAWTKDVSHSHSQDTAYITMENIDVLTDYLCTPAFLTDSGKVRSVIVSEVGYDSSRNEAQQATSIVFGYMQAMNNRHIDGFILFRQQDHPTEVSQGLASGLEHYNGVHKPSYEFYKHVDSKAIQDQALAIMGISSWSDVLTPR